MKSKINFVDVVSFPFLPSSITMAIYAAPAPPRPGKPATYGGYSRRSSTTNPSSPFKSPLPRENETLPSSATMSLATSSMEASSSQLSSPPPEIMPKPNMKRGISWESPAGDAEESMEVEDQRSDDELDVNEQSKSENEIEDEEDEEDEEEDEYDGRPIVHSQFDLGFGAPS
jgi:hypothetical protein